MNKRSQAVIEWRRRTKQKLLDMMGNKCALCGYKKSQWALHFHHLNPAEKLFSIGTDGVPRSWETTKAEAKKCILLCANCHRREHALNPHAVNPSGKVVQHCLVHGTGPFYSYKKRGKIVHSCCYCNLEKQRARRWKLKSELIEVLGGKCNVCEETSIEVLEFHHLKDKKDVLAGLMNNPTKARSEVLKCELLCANCHNERHHFGFNHARVAQG